jgi:hypothetical protein
MLLINKSDQSARKDWDNNEKSFVSFNASADKHLLRIKIGEGATASSVHLTATEVKDLQGYLQMYFGK